MVDEIHVVFIVWLRILDVSVLHFNKQKVEMYLNWLSSMLTACFAQFIAVFENFLNNFSNSSSKIYDLLSMMFVYQTKPISSRHKSRQSQRPNWLTPTISMSLKPAIEVILNFVCQRVYKIQTKRLIAFLFFI